jgi:hypothetical protein
VNGKPGIGTKSVGCMRTQELELQMTCKLVSQLVQNKELFYLKCLRSKEDRKKAKGT